MKKTTLLIIALGFCFQAVLYTQNTFPSSGNVGIGITSPAAALSFTDCDATTSPTGITWYSGGGSQNATAYAIHKTAGSWISPDYQQLRLGWNTGIVLDPGTQYGKSYVDITGNGLRITNGSIGIGTTTPSEKLEVVGSIYMRSENNGIIIDEGGNKRVGFMKYAGREGGIWRTQNMAFEIGRTNTTTLPGTPTVFTTDLFVAGSGSVGIGTKNVGDGNYKLFVETGIRTRKVKVDVANWADYVFSSSYKLPSLREVEAFVKQHQHLPGVVSEAEVKKEGLDLGENQAMLLKKIEELTLYIIDQNKKIESQQSEITNLKDQNKEFQNFKKDLEIIKAKLQN